MKKQSGHVRCRECHEQVAEAGLRDHWMAEHSGKLEKIDEWLGKVDQRVKVLGGVAEEGMRGFKEGK